MAKKFLLTLLFAPIFVGVASSQTLTELQKIEQLIQSVEQLKGAEFMRNGTAYSAQQAAAHLRAKLKKAGGRVKTAQDFIDGVASASYLSGKPYYIRFNDGKQVTSKEFFEGRLREIIKN